MTSIARRHHYLPQAYLAAFTDTGTINGRFFVLDTVRGIYFRTSPKNVAVEKDFNRVDVEGKSSDIIENTIAPCEDSATQAIRNVNRTKTFPSDDDFIWVLNLLCLFAVRNPQYRKSFNDSRERVAQVIMDLLVSNKDLWAHHLKKAQEMGYVEETAISFEECKRFIEEGEYKIEIPPDDNIWIELDTFRKILQILAQRTWSLLVAPSLGPDFICSDHPVALTFKGADKGPIGYGLKNTEVFFPLGPKTGLYGVYEDALPPVAHMNQARVAMINTLVWNSAQRHVFCATDALFLWDEGKAIKVNCAPK